MSAPCWVLTMLRALGQSEAELVSGSSPVAHSPEEREALLGHIRGLREKLEQAHASLEHRCTESAEPETALDEARAKLAEAEKEIAYLRERKDAIHARLTEAVAGTDKLVGAILDPREPCCDEDADLRDKLAEAEGVLNADRHSFVRGSYAPPTKDEKEPPR